ncbi:MAG: aldo/keto reductase, partial [Cyanobacteria bacterium P01_H01_bin.121]
MQYRRFGRTNLTLSVFSLGLMRCLESADSLKQVLVASLDAGINHLETAAAYGSSEAYLGQVLCQLQLGTAQPYLTTKLAPQANAQELAVHLDQSLQRLGVECLDCVALHGLNTAQHWDWSQRPGGCLDVLEMAQQAGKVRYIGFSTHGPLALILEAIASQRFDFVNLHYYWLWQRQAAAIAMAQAQDLGVLIISPADKGGQLYAPSAVLEDLCAPLNPLELNYRFLLSDSRITTLSLGASGPPRLSASDRHQRADGTLDSARTAN